MILPPNMILLNDLTELWAFESEGPKRAKRQCDTLSQVNSWEWLP